MVLQLVLDFVFNMKYTWSASNVLLRIINVPVPLDTIIELTKCPQEKYSVGAHSPSSKYQKYHARVSNISTNHMTPCTLDILMYGVILVYIQGIY